MSRWSPSYAPHLNYEQFIERSFALDRAGHVNAKGRGNPLRMATAKPHEAEFFLPRIPIGLQRALLRALDRLGRRLPGPRGCRRAEATRDCSFSIISALSLRRSTDASNCSFVVKQKSSTTPDRRPPRTNAGCVDWPRPPRLLVERERWSRRRPDIPPGGRPSPAILAEPTENPDR